jgi:tol-pal system protein YbgF
MKRMTGHNYKRKTLTAAAFAAAVACSAPLLAAPSVQERLDALERKVDSRGLIDLYTQLEQLQRDLQKLRGDLEVQNHTIEDLQRSQREQYLDIDRRLRVLEGGQAAGPAAAPGVAPGTAAAPPAGTPAGSAGAGAPPAKRFDFSPGGGSAPAGNNVGGMPVTDMQLAPSEGTAPPAGNPADEKSEYESALAILRDGRYSDAALAFKQFISNHPTGSYTDNAYYWLGETYYVTRDFDQAQATFRELTTRFPQSPKVADSHLKLGFIDYEKKDWKAARSELENVVNTWPTSTAARLASERLARMKQEHH